MKIKVLLIFCLLFWSSVHAGDDSYINALRNCSPFTDSGSISVDGVQASSKKQIYGWINGKCSYKETIIINGINADITCKFSKPQIDEIVSVADAYLYTLKYSKEQPDISSLDSIKNNPISNVFNKYVQDPSVCSINSF